MGISTSRLCDRRAYRGRIDGEYRMRAPSVASRSRTRGWRTATGPMPVMISRSGRWPWRTTRCWPVSVLRSVCFARNSATSASTAWVSSARAPLRRISVRESVKAPGWASLMTLLSDTAYHSFIGEVEALNTTTIRRLTRSCRHHLPAIAPGGGLGVDRRGAGKGDRARYERHSDHSEREQEEAFLSSVEHFRRPPKKFSHGNMGVIGSLSGIWLLSLPAVDYFRTSALPSGAAIVRRR